VSRPTRADPTGRAYLDLQNRARREGRPTQALLVMYVLERFLARLAASPYANQFVLKGGHAAGRLGRPPPHRGRRPPKTHRAKRDGGMRVR
jgi:hypothetical protein